MLSNLKTRAGDEKGFTLIELLVVILIIAILAAVAIPTFLNQRGKAYDSNAQSMVKNMQTAEETFATNNNGTYSSNLSDLNAIDPSIPSSGSNNGVTPAAPTANTSTGYTVAATADSTGDKFTIVETNGQETNTCTAGSGGGHPGACPTSGTW